MSKKSKFIKGGKIIAFPAKALFPMGKLLTRQLKKLKKRRKDVDESDPFKNTSRVTDNASPDADAEEQFGHARTTAIKKQLDIKIVQTRKALARIKIGKYGLCEECGSMINTDRLVVYPETTVCVKCESKKSKRNP